EALKKQHAEELAARDTKIAALETGLKAAQDAEAARRKREVESYMAQLREKAKPNAIPEESLGKVRALLERGDDETAKLVGDLLLKNAKQGEQDSQGTTVSLRIGEGASTTSAEESDDEDPLDAFSAYRNHKGSLSAAKG